MVDPKRFEPLSSKNRRQRFESVAMVEVAGIEPASLNPPIGSATCLVFHLLNASGSERQDTDTRASASLIPLTRGASTGPACYRHVIPPPGETGTWSRFIERELTPGRPAQPLTLCSRKLNQRASSPLQPVARPRTRGQRSHWPHPANADLTLRCFVCARCLKRPPCNLYMLPRPK